MAKALAAIDERKLAKYPPASRRRDRRAGVAAGREPRPRSICSIPIRGRSGGTGSGASCRTRASREIARALRPGGEFRFASDIPDYVGVDADAADALAGFRLDRGAGRRLAQAVAGWSGTRYEAKAKREGRVPCYLIFRAKSRRHSASQAAQARPMTGSRVPITACSASAQGMIRIAPSARRMT